MAKAIEEKKAKTTEYVIDDDLTRAVSELLTDVPQLQALRDNEIVILCCMKIKMDDVGETEPPKGNPVKLKKIPEMERVFVADNAQYVLVVDYHFWKNATQKQQSAKLFDELMRIKVEVTKSGLKLKTREPSVTVHYTETLALFGTFDEPTLILRDALKNIDKRLKDFVDDAGPTSPKAKKTEASKRVSEPKPEPEPAPEEAPESGPEPVPSDDEPEPEPAPKTKGNSSNKK